MAAMQLAGLLPVSLCRRVPYRLLAHLQSTNPRRQHLCTCTAPDSQLQDSATTSSVLKVKTSSLPGPQAQMLSDVIMELGALSSSIEEARGEGDEEQEVFADGPAAEVWDKCTVSALFQAGQDALQLMEVAASIADADASFQTESVEERDWVKTIEDSFQAIQVTPSMWIVPNEADISDQDAINILMKPGAAFGTGEHPTTKLCLQWLDRQQLQDKLVLDYGTGTGILGIAALLKGAAEVMGTDVDPIALQAAHRNAAANGIGANFQVQEVGRVPAAPHQPQQYDICVANILKGPLLELAPVLAAQLKAGALLGLSGILTTQVAEVQAAYGPHFDDFELMEYDKWALLTARRRHT